MALFTDSDVTTNTVDVPVGQSTITDNGVVSLKKVRWGDADSF